MFLQVFQNNIFILLFFNPENLGKHNVTKLLKRKTIFQKYEMLSKNQYFSPQKNLEGDRKKSNWKYFPIVNI